MDFSLKHECGSNPRPESATGFRNPPPIRHHPGRSRIRSGFKSGQNPQPNPQPDLVADFSPNSWDSVYCWLPLAAGGCYLPTRRVVGLIHGPCFFLAANFSCYTLTISLAVGPPELAETVLQKFGQPGTENRPRGGQHGQDF